MNGETMEAVGADVLGGPSRAKGGMRSAEFGMRETGPVRSSPADPVGADALGGTYMSPDTPVGEGLAPPVPVDAGLTAGGASPAPTEWDRDDAVSGERGSYDPDALRAHFDSLRTQAEALRRDYPDFDLDAALRDPAFLRLTAPALGVGVREAYCALHREELDARERRRAAEASRTLLSRAVAAGTLRTREGGGLESAALTRSDYRSLSRNAREQLKQEIRAAAARGEKVYP